MLLGSKLYIGKKFGTLEKKFFGGKDVLSSWWKIFMTSCALGSLFFKIYIVNVDVKKISYQQCGRGDFTLQVLKNYL